MQQGIERRTHLHVDEVGLLAQRRQQPRPPRAGEPAAAVLQVGQVFQAQLVHQPGRAVPEQAFAYSASEALLSALLQPAHSASHARSMQSDSSPRLG